MHIFYIQKLQAFDESDYPHRLEFVSWVMDRMKNDPQFTFKVLFTDKVTFTSDNMFNMHNAHIWFTENSHAKVPLYIGFVSTCGASF